MKNIFNLCVIAVALAGSAFSQTAMRTTTLAQAVGNTDLSFNLASGTGVTVGTILFVDKEFMTVQSVRTAAVSVQRGQFGSDATAHNSAATVYVGSPGAYGTRNLSGACTAGSWPVTPYININNGNIYTCSGGVWVQSGTGGTGNLPTATVSTLPAASVSTNLAYIVTDGSTSSDCTVGGGSTRVICVSNGTVWASTGGSGSSVTAGFGLVDTAGTFSVNNAVIAELATVQAGTPWYCRSTTGNDTYTCTMSPSETSTSLTRGQYVFLDPDTANTGAATISIGGGTTRDIVTTAGAAPADGAIVANRGNLIYWNGTNFNQVGAASSSSGGTITMLEPTGKTMDSALSGPGVSANQVIYWKFPVLTSTTVRYYNAYPYSAKGVGTQGFALMDSSCNRVTGSTATVAAPGSAPIRADMGASITLTPGMYYVAYTSTSATDALFGVRGDFSGQVPNQGFSDPNLSYFSGATASASGVVPTSCGAQTGLSSSQGLFFVRLSN